MKNLFAAVFLTCICFSVAAQSTIKLAGKIDLGLVKTTGDGNRDAMVSNRLVDSGGSSFGLHGVEDLGDGLKLDFKLICLFLSDTGETVTPALFWYGASYIGLQNSWGHVRVGRWYTPAWEVSAQADPFQTRTIGAAALVVKGPDGLSHGYAPLRFGRAIFYESSNLDGIVAKFAYTMPGGTAPTPATAPLAPIPTPFFHQTSVSIDYTNGNLYLGIGSERDNVQTGFTRLAINYKIGASRLLALYDHGHNQGTKARTLSLGTLISAGPGTIRAVYSQRVADLPINDHKKAVIGYLYKLSPLTQIYTDLAHIKMPGSATQQFDLGMLLNF